MNTSVLLHLSGAINLLESLSSLDFIKRLVPEADILTCSPEYGGYSEHNNDSGANVTRFLLDERRIGFLGGGTVAFERATAPWLVTESITFTIYRLWEVPPVTLREKDWKGCEVLQITWFANTSTRSGIRFSLKDAEIDSPAIQYGLEIRGRAISLFERKK